MDGIGALIFLVRTLTGLYIIMLLLRLLFQVVRADFYNPLSQTLVKLTAPLVSPLRRVVPPMGRVDSATLLLAVLFQVLLIVVVLFLQGMDIQGLIAQPLNIVMLTLFALIHRVLDIYTFSLFIMVILSWVAPHSRNPIALLASQLTDPLLRPLRNAIPPAGGLDFSVMIALLLLYMLNNFFIPRVPF